MITKFILTNWKSFGEATVFFDPLTVLIGANDSGKSNLLEALWFLSQLPRARSLDHIFDDEPSRPAIRGGVHSIFRHEQPFTTLTLEVDGSLLGDEVRLRYSLTLVHRERIVRVESESLVSVDADTGEVTKSIFATKTASGDTPVLKATVSTPGRGRPPDYDFERTRPLLVQLDNGLSAEAVKPYTGFVLEHLKGIRAFDPQPALMRGYSQRSYRLHPDGANLAGYLAQLSLDEQERVGGIISEQLEGLSEGGIRRVYASVVLPIKTDATLVADGGERDPLAVPIDGRLLSDGTLRYLAIVVAIVTAPSGTLLVLEEVDDGLHPARADQLARFLREQAIEREVDILFTTHNAELLDRLGPEIVPFTYLVYRPEPGGPSAVKRIEEIDRLPQLLGMGGVGSMAASGRLQTLIDE